MLYLNIQTNNYETNYCDYPAQPCLVLSSTAGLRTADMGRLADVGRAKGNATERNLCGSEQSDTGRRGVRVNPVIPADFSDIDCIEHEGYYYAISSTFQFEPGMVILRSADMVNWQVYSHAVPDVSQISEIAFVRPTAGHAYVLEGSLDGQTWTRVGGHDDCQKRSPHTDRLEGTYRYLRLTITLGIKGVYEWNLYE